MRAIIAISLLALAGCAGGVDAQRAAEAQDDAKCRSYGTARGSQAYMQCRMSLDQGRALGEAAARQGSYSTMMSVGAGMMR